MKRTKVYTVWAKEYGCDDCWFPMEHAQTTSIRQAGRVLVNLEESYPQYKRPSITVHYKEDEKKEDYDIYDLCTWTGELTLVEGCK